MRGFLRTGEVAKALRVSVDTLRRWEADGPLTFERHNDQRVLSPEALKPLMASSAAPAWARRHATGCPASSSRSSATA